MIAKPVAQLMTLELVQEHKTKEDLWIVVHDKVYDLTSFAPDHPGGMDILVECAGTDASEPFEYAGHSEDAVRSLDKYQVGMLYQDTGSQKHVTVVTGDDGLTQKVLSTTTSLEKQVQTLSLKLLTADHGRKLLLLAATCLGLGVLSFLFAMIADINAIAWSSGNGITTMTAFAWGVLLALAVGGSGVGWLYAQISKTWDHEADVFAYPAVKPWRPVKNINAG